MNRLPIVLFACAALLLFVEQAVAEGRRVALVIGMGAYENVPVLPNAVNDANAMAEMFRKANFEVVTARTDLKNIDLRRALREFEEAAAGAEIAIVFYAGHGIEVRDQNYLIPTDAKLVNERDVEDEAIPLDRIISTLESAKRLRLIILDACRDNPFASKMRRRVATRAVSQGLAKVEPAQLDTLIAYAAKDKAVANDGQGDHSPYTRALLDHLMEPGLDIRLAFGLVRDDVLRATNSQQEPYLYGSLGGGTVALVPAMPMAYGNVSDQGMKQDYEAVERLGTREAWLAFLDKYPTGLYAELAKSQLRKFSDTSIANVANVSLTHDVIEATPPAVPEPPKIKIPSVAVEPKPTRVEQDAWNKLEGSTDLRAIRAFVDRYPSSPLAVTARRRIDILERIARDQAEALRAEREAIRQHKEEEDRRRKAEAEQKSLEREAALLREREEKAKAIELRRQKAAEEAAAKQREADEKAQAAAAEAERRAAVERARAAEAAARRREAEERAQALQAERQKAVEEATARKREAEEAAKAAAAAKAARDAEERERVRQAQELERQERTRAAEIAAREKEAEARAKAAELAAQKKQAEDEAERRKDEDKLRTAVSDQDRAQAAAEIERKKAAEAAEAAGMETGLLVPPEDAEALAGALGRLLDDGALRQRLGAAGMERARRAAAAKQHEDAQEARRAAVEAIAARKKAAEAARRAAKIHAEQAEAAVEKRLKAAAKAKEAARNRAPVIRAGVHAPTQTAYGAPPASTRTSAAAKSSGSTFSSTDIGAARMMSRMP